MMVIVLSVLGVIVGVVATIIDHHFSYIESIEIAGFVDSIDSYIQSTHNIINHNIYSLFIAYILRVLLFYSFSSSHLRSMLFFFIIIHLNDVLAACV